MPSWIAANRPASPCTAAIAHTRPARVSSTKRSGEVSLWLLVDMRCRRYPGRGCPACLVRLDAVASVIAGSPMAGKGGGRRSDRQSVGGGQRGTVRVQIGGRRYIKTNKYILENYN